MRVKGHLDGRWSQWFDGLQITNLENAEAMLSGSIVDQAALHGVLIQPANIPPPECQRPGRCAEGSHYVMTAQAIPASGHGASSFVGRYQGGG